MTITSEASIVRCRRRLLSLDEITAVVNYHRGRENTLRTQVRLVVFRLAACCGLRCGEIVGLNVGDLAFSEQWPALHVRPETTKHYRGRARGRFVPLWYDKGTLEDLRKYHQRRVADHAAVGSDPFVISAETMTFGVRLQARQLHYRWRRMLTRVLGRERAYQIRLHDGRHMYGTYLLYGGRSLPEVRDAMGHQNIKTTSIYLQVLEDDGTIGDIFGNNGHDGDYT